MYVCMTGGGTFFGKSAIMVLMFGGPVPAGRKVPCLLK